MQYNQTKPNHSKTESTKEQISRTGVSSSNFFYVISSPLDVEGSSTSVEMAD